jgi:hypothetical protein
MLTEAPPAGAGPLKVRVNTAVAPEVTGDGLMFIALSAAAAGITVTVATWLEPPYAASTVTVVMVETTPHTTLKLPPVCPAGINNDAGAGKRAMSWLDTATRAPPAGAGPLKVSVIVAVPPDGMVVGLTPIELKATAAAAGITVTVASLTTPPEPASEVTLVAVATVPVVTVKLALDCPAGIMYGEATGSAVMLPLPTNTCAPPAGAGPLNVKVSVTVAPEVTVAGLME